MGNRTHLEIYISITIELYSVWTSQPFKNPRPTYYMSC